MELVGKMSKQKLLLALTGSVASIKALELVKTFQPTYQIQVVATDSAIKFIKTTNDLFVPYTDYGGAPLPEMFLDSYPLKDKWRIHSDTEEWRWKRIGDTITHIDLKDWADVFVVAPLSANTLAKFAHGICDNLVTSIYRAYPVNKPIVLAPAMNTDMWEHPLTQEHLNVLAKRHSRIKIVQPVSKMLACGVEGIGALAPAESVLSEINDLLPCPMCGASETSFSGCNCDI